MLADMVHQALDSRRNRYGRNDRAGALEPGSFENAPARGVTQHDPMTLVLGEAEPLYIPLECNVRHTARLQRRRNETSNAAAPAHDHVARERLARLSKQPFCNRV